MCRSTLEVEGGKRCEKCNDPENRRNRQNLANHVKREQSQVLEENKTAVKTDDAPKTLADVLTAGLKDTEEAADVDETVLRQTLESMLADPKVARTLAEDIRKGREGFGNDRDWILQGREDTPENFAAGLSERGTQILTVGTLVSERAQAIHGLDIEEEREKWKNRLEEGKKEFEKLQKESGLAMVEHSAYKRSLMEKYDAYSYDFQKYISEDEKAELNRLALERKGRKEAEEQGQRDLQKTLVGRDPETQEVLTKISEASMQAVGEIREVGNVEVNHTSRIRSKEDIPGQFQKAVSSVMPDEWIEKSNAFGALEVSRAGKNERDSYRSALKGSKFSTYLRSKPAEGDDRFAGWTEKLDETGNPTGKWHGPKRDFLEEKNYRNFKKFNDDGTPKGKGWVRGKAEGRAGNLITGWVRDNPTEQKARESDGAMMSLSVDASGSISHSATIHEFSHRIEDTNPTIKAMEEWWVASRTTNENGRRDPLKNFKNNQLGGIAFGDTSNKEVVREDKFVTPYIGREYAEGSREVLSVGTESMFGGRYGGLVGIGNQRSDPEMRSFIFGMYATL